MLENTLVAVFVLIYGLIIGSFLNVCIYRIPIGKSVAKGRSYCPHCDSLIPWYLNIPLFSYLCLRGRCGNCQAPISPIYPLVEALNGILYLLAWYTYGLSVEGLFAAILLSLLVVVAFIDMKHKIIPNSLVIMIFVLGVLHAVYQSVYLGVDWYLGIIGLVAASVPLLLIMLIYPQGMGGGDVKLMAAAGVFLGPKILLALFIGALCGGFFSFFLLACRKGTMKSEIPFGPFLSFGIFTAVIFGEALLSLYLSTFF
ncbi:prepilin peptidase [Dehalobacter sp. DCM]|uniref:prepilin peptidase n=1 Tax=Dehalobacter sp. DCM TaxID=2907827 RepID=UPI0030815F92|nr:prepilin peptidase [Dehalobacter sp. DCM]